MRKALLALLVLLVAVGLFPASAQDEQNPLLEMLARIPDGVAAREWLTYADYHALISARPGAPLPESWADFEAIIDDDDEEQDLLMSALFGLQSGPQFFPNYLMQASDMPGVVGFDIFEVERAAEYGEPPGQVAILEGDFDADGVIAAHESRDYTQSEAGTLTLLCPSAGCETGAQQNLRERNLSNPFGGELGRSQPVLLDDAVIASSTDDQALHAVAETMAGEQDSLADQPDYRAAAEALASFGTILQTYFISPLDIAPLSASVINSRITPEELEALIEQLHEDFEPLPQYNLVVLAHTATEDQQQAVVALVYASSEAAATAAEMLPARLEAYTSLATQQPFMDMLTERGVTSIEASVYDSSVERPVVLLTLHAPLPATEPPEGESNIQSLGLPYSALVQALMRRDLGWLATAF